MFFIGSLSWGGAEKIITLLAQSYLDKGYKVYIVTVLSNKNVFDLDPRIEVVSIARENKSNISNVGHWIKSIKSLLANIKPSIVVSFVCRINLLVIYAKVKSKLHCRLIISERNDPRYDTRGTLAKIALRYLYPKADLLICQTSKEKAYFTKKIQAKTVVIPNPVFLTAEPVPFEQKKKIIINAARYDESKNQKLLIDAFTNVVSKDKDNEFELHFYGSGSLKESLVNCVKDKHMDSKIKIFDSIKTVQQKISEASIFCLSSNYEGMSNALMEALLLGTPSISTDTSGADDLIIDGKNGYIISDNDAGDLENALTTLINDSNLRKSMYDYCLSRDYQDRFVKSLQKYQSYINGDRD